ncbi:MAG: hypothetical protein AAFY08_00775 [Planctomycetota bacterium]
MAEALSLTSRVGELAGVSERAVEAFARLGVVSVLDLLRHYPSRYEREAAESGVGGGWGGGGAGGGR